MCSYLGEDVLNTYTLSIQDWAMNAAVDVSEDGGVLEALSPPPAILPLWS